MSGTLYLIPVTLGGDDVARVLPATTLENGLRATYDWLLRQQGWHGPARATGAPPAVDRRRAPVA